MGFSIGTTKTFNRPSVTHQTCCQLQLHLMSPTARIIESERNIDKKKSPVLRSELTPDLGALPKRQPAVMYICAVGVSDLISES